MYSEFLKDLKTEERFEHEVIRCGEYLTDDNFDARHHGYEYYTRIRIIRYNNELYYHKMHNGEVIEFKKIGVVE